MAEEQKLPFHRRYRPVNLKDYIGNEKIKNTIMRTLEVGNRPQVILLHGPSGCGKTSLARLIAKEYSCENRDADNGACNECSSCRTLNEYITSGDTGILINIKEVNMSDQNGKNSLNWVLEDMQMPSYGNDWKVYIFDECHKATEAAQNMLLKGMEEPPDHVLLIFCTTNPEKMLDTFLNRCQLKLKVQKPTEDELAGLLKMVCEKENAPYNMSGLRFIAQRSELTIRTSLTLLEQVINEESSAEYEFVLKVVDALSDAFIVDFFRCLKKKDTLQYVTNLVKIKEKIDLVRFIEQVKSFVKRGIYTINGIDVQGVTKNDLAIYKQLFGDMGVVQVSMLLNKLLTFNERNLELELLLWGYTGLDEPQTIATGETPIVKPLDSELQMEQANASKEIREHQEIDVQQGIKNAEKLMETVSVDDLLKMCGTVVN